MGVRFSRPGHGTSPTCGRFGRARLRLRQRTLNRDPRAVPRTKALRREIRREPQDAVRRARRCSSSLTISSRAVSQSVVCTRPSATSRDRRSNSPAQAAATSSSGSSRLASSSSATRARSRRERRNASTSNSSVNIRVSVAPARLAPGDAIDSGVAPRRAGVGKGGAAAEPSERTLAAAEHRGIIKGRWRLRVRDAQREGPGGSWRPRCEALQAGSETQLHLSESRSSLVTTQSLRSD